MRALAFLPAIVASLACAPLVRADAAEPIRRGVPGVVERGGFILGLDNVFGYASGGDDGPRSFGLGPGVRGTRLSFHGVTTLGITIGGVFMPGMLRHSTGAHGVYVIAGPRVGYLLMSPRGVGVWPRAGINALFTAGHMDDPALIATLDAPLVVSVTEHAALTIGPTLDRAWRGPNYDSVGVTAGLLGVF